MEPNEQRRFNKQYQKHITALKLQDMADTTHDIYARAVRRVVSVYDCCRDRITQDQFRAHIVALIDSHSWSTVNSDRAGLNFFFKHVLRTEWDWGDIVKPKKVKSLPDVVTYAQMAALINATRERHYEAFSYALTAWDCAWLKPCRWKARTLMPPKSGFMCAWEKARRIAT